MRTLQVIIFCIGLLSFGAALFFIGQDMGDTLWKAGVTFLLIDLVLVKLWPASK